MGLDILVGKKPIWAELCSELNFCLSCNKSRVLKPQVCSCCWLWNAHVILSCIGRNGAFPLFFAVRQKASLLSPWDLAWKQSGSSLPFYSGRVKLFDPCQYLFVLSLSHFEAGFITGSCSQSAGRYSAADRQGHRSIAQKHKQQLEGSGDAARDVTQFPPCLRPE